MKKKFIVINLVLVLFSCQQTKYPDDKDIDSQQQLKKASSEIENSKKSIDTTIITYEWTYPKEWLLEHETDTLKQQIAFAINRTDLSNFTRMDSVIIPTDFRYDKAKYLPFPLEVNYLKGINKIIFFSYPTQTFAAYEKGILKITGPTNMGREEYLTPTGLYFTNWKAKVKISTIDDDWILNWNFNILNKEGIGWHEYSLPGYPASHSCLRLQKKDAKFLYYWADQWVLADQYTILVKGTPVVIFGKYDFSSAKPWHNLISNPKSIDITKTEMEKITQPYLNEILAAQKNRDTLVLKKAFQ
ncbi:L,D-transpeptidase [uncultured Flavobacterium sp.]|uniref:L,D-transpeptidase n=1 Tax=uncultured Flavobacterium sp. TaxID=165435 RepID=UPI0030ED14CA|tara:strand:+ start:217892 stop:218794 length:903 start_codon:yes stop_codon:yes gene_type:complete